MSARSRTVGCNMLVLPAAGLAAVPGIAGLHVAHKWLADLLVHLSKDVTAYSAVKVVRLLRGCL